MEMISAVIFEARFRDLEIDRLSEIADVVMTQLLAEPQIVDPSVALDGPNCTLEIEVLVPGAKDLEDAKQIGSPLIRSALSAAGAERAQQDTTTSSELVPA